MKPSVFFLVKLEKDSGIYTYSQYLARGLSSLGVKVDIDKPRQKKYDIIHIHNPSPQNILYAKIKFPSARIVGVDLVTEDEIVEFIPQVLKGLAKKYMEYYFGNCEKVICISRSAFEKLGKKIKDKLVFIPCPVNTKAFSRNQKEGEKFRKKFSLGKKTVLCVASLQKRKGVLDFMKVARMLPQYDFLWAGRIPVLFTLDKRLEMERLLRKAPANCRFLGMFSEKELVGAFSGSDIFFFPSHSETFGIALAEAASCGMPVVARRLEVYENFKDFAVFFDAAEEASRQISRALEDQNELERLSKLSLSCREKFSEKKIAQQVLSVYMELIEEKGPTK